jgi:long-chain acyl-CoA synthetase
MTDKAADTLPSLLSWQAAEQGDGPACHDPYRGIWRSHRWNVVADRVFRLAAALSGRGVGAGDTVAVIGNRPALFWAAIAAQSIGAVPLLLPSALPATALTDALTGRGVRAVFVDGHHEVRLLASLRDRLPSLALVVAEQTGGPWRWDEQWLASYQDLIASAGGASPETVASPHDIAFIVISADDAGAPRTDSISHAAAIERARRAAQFADTRRSDRVFAALPLSWLDGLIHHQVLSLLAGFPLIYPGQSTVLRDLRDAAPTLLFGPPQFYERLREEIAGRIVGTRVRRRLTAAQEGAAPSLLGRLLWRDRLSARAGLSRVRFAASFNQAPQPETVRFFARLGIAIHDLDRSAATIDPESSQSALGAREFVVAHEAA